MVKITCDTETIPNPSRTDFTKSRKLDLMIAIPDSYT
jgi:hypothetical protein